MALVQFGYALTELPFLWFSKSRSTNQNELMISEPFKLNHRIDGLSQGSRTCGVLQKSWWPLDLEPGWPLKIEPYPQAGRVPSQSTTYDGLARDRLSDAMLRKEAVVLARGLPLEVPDELLVDIDRDLIIEQIIILRNKRSEALMMHFVVRRQMI